jgi:hypothetical protein
MTQEQSHSGERQLTPYELLDASSEFLSTFGVEPSPIENPEQFLEALEQFSPRYSGERTLLRYELQESTQEFTPEVQDVIHRTAEAYGMKDEQTPLRGDYDAVIILGAARQANLDRARYAVDAWHRHDVTFRHLIIAGSGRPLGKGEPENTANYAPGAQTEFDLCVGAAQTVARENPGLSVSVLQVPDKSDGGLPGTPEVIDAVLADLRDRDDIHEEESAVATVTTQIYQPWTKFDTERIAKRYGITDVYVAGNPSDPEIVAKRKTATYLAEIIRALKAATLALQDEVA